MVLFDKFHSTNRIIYKEKQVLKIYCSEYFSFLLQNKSLEIIFIMYFCDIRNRLSVSHRDDI